MGRCRLLGSDAPGDGGLGVAPDLLLRHDPVLEVVLGDGELGGAVLRAPVQVEVAVRRAPELVLQKVASESHPKVRNHGEGPY